MKFDQKLRLVTLLPVLGALAFATGCGSDGSSSTPGGSVGGSATAGGSSAGGSATAGGSSAGGSATAGGSSAGGSSAGGSSAGGSDAGDSSAGDSNAGSPNVGSSFVKLVGTWASLDCPGSNCPSRTEPEPGTQCISGNNPPSVQSGMLFFPAPTTAHGFDADALGITQVSFTIDSPPAGGVLVDAGIFVNRAASPSECVGLPPGADPNVCIVTNFTLPRITGAGTTTAPLVDFLQSKSDSAYQEFDRQSLALFGFTVGEGPYDFCVRNFRFLDATGQEVQPNPAP